VRSALNKTIQISLAALHKTRSRSLVQASLQCLLFKSLSVIFQLNDLNCITKSSQLSRFGHEIISSLVERQVVCGENPERADKALQRLTGSSQLIAIKAAKICLRLRGVFPGFSIRLRR